MGLERVVQKVLDKGKEDADAIIDEGKKEAQAIINEANKKAKKMIEGKKKEAREEIQRVRRWELSAVEIEAKRNILNAKKQLLDNVYNITLEHLSTLSKEKREAILKVLISKASKEFKRGYIYCNDKDAKFVMRKENLKFGGNIDCIGGIIVENEEKTVKIDYLYETILNEVWRESLKRVSDILFS